MDNSGASVCRIESYGDGLLRFDIGVGGNIGEKDELDGLEGGEEAKAESSTEDSRKSSEEMDG
jgi:hypothetical protein